MLYKLSQYVADIAVSETMEDLRDSLTRATSGLGFTSYNLSLDKRDAAEFVESPTLTTLSESDRVRYLQDGWLERDPRLRQVMTAEKAFLWASDDWRARGFKDYAAFLDLARVQGGVSIPLHHSETRRGAMTLIARPGLLPTQEILHGAKILTHMAVARASALREHIGHTGEHLRRIRLLSARQKEILRWVALGKTNREIAVIVGSSRRTVDYHLQEILSKLQVATRTEAVAIFVSTEL